MKKLLAYVLVLLIVIENVFFPIKSYAKRVICNSTFDFQRKESKFSEIQAEQIEEIELELGNIPEDYTNTISSLKPSTYGVCRTSFWGEMPDGGYQLVVYDEKLYVNYYDEMLHLNSSQTLELELPKWGGVYLGENNNYVVCGEGRQSSESNGGEVYRVIQYDKYFRRIDSTSFSSEETFTSVPFSCGNVSITENDSTLIIYTSRLRLDGHQSNIALRINTGDMTVADASGMISFPDVHVSHSFRQIVKYDGKKPVYIDLSDTYPERSIYLQSDYGNQAVLGIAGQDGDNVTDTEVTGVGISENSYLVTGSSINNEENNIFLSCYNKNTKTAEITWLTGCSVFSAGTKVGNSQLVQIAYDRYVIVWNIQNGAVASLNYVIVDGMGNTVSQLRRKKDVELTDMEICCNEKYGTHWVRVQKGKILLQYGLDYQENGNYQIPGDYEKAINVWDGTSDTSWYSPDKLKFEISTAEQLAGLAELVNLGNDFTGKKLFLNNDLFLNEEPLSNENVWSSIAERSGSSSEQISFQGEFHGNGHTIYNMYVSKNGKGGLFGQIGKEGLVSAVDVSQGRCDYGGVIADCNEGIIQFCRNFCLVGHQGSTTGGICNSNYNLIYKCQNAGTVWGTGVGGIVGINNKAGTLNECSNIGCVQGTLSVGGIAASNSGWIYNSYNVGILEDCFDGMNVAGYMAGIVVDNVKSAGELCGYVENCYSVCGYNHTDGGGCWVDPICNWNSDEQRIARCYYYHPEFVSDCSEKIDLETFFSQEMVLKLNQGGHDVMPCWTQDNENNNNGFPINVADINYQKRIYKRMPEVWVFNKEKELSGDLAKGTCEVSLAMYFNDSIPVVSLDTPELGEVIYQGDEKKGKIIVELQKKGTGDIIIEFPETEYICQSIYQLKLNVTDSTEYITPEPTANAPSAKPSASPVVPTTLPTAKPSIINPTTAPWDVSSGTQNSFDFAKEKIKTGQTVIVNDMKYKVIKLNENGMGELALTGINRKKFNQEFTTVKIEDVVTINGISFRITSISKNAFSGYRKLKSVIIGKNIKVIENKAFYKCTGLKKIIIPSNIVKIGKRAFYGCKKLKNINIKTKKLKLKNVGKKAFYKIAEKAEIKVPKKKLKIYKKLLKARGVGRKVKIKK